MSGDIAYGVVCCSLAEAGIAAHNPAEAVARADVSTSWRASEKYDEKYLLICVLLLLLLGRLLIAVAGLRRVALLVSAAVGRLLSRVANRVRMRAR